MKPPSTNSSEAEIKLLQASWEKAADEQVMSLGSPLSRPELTPDLTVAAAIRFFLATLKGQSPQTLKTYRVSCRRFSWFLYTSGQGEPVNLAVRDLSPLVLEDYYLWLVQQYGRTARATVNGYMAGTRNLFEFLARRHVTPRNCQYQEMIAGLSKLQGRASYRTPRLAGKQVEQVVRLVEAHRVKLPADDALHREQAPVKEGATNLFPTLEERPDRKADPMVSNSLALSSWGKARSEQEKIRRHLEELRDRAIILTLYTTGMRRQEVASLNRNDLEPVLLEAGIRLEFARTADHPASVKIEPEGTSDIFQVLITGKGQKERLVYFDRLTLLAIADYLLARGNDDKYQPLFLQHHRNRNLSEAGRSGENYRVGLRVIWEVVKKYASRMGLKIHPHDFRHNLATTLLNAGAQLSEVQDILGHASPTTTKQIYAHYEQSHLQEAFSRYRKSASDLD